MKYGAGFPLKALPDATAIREYARSLEEAGFDFTSTAGHVLGQPAGSHPDRAAPQYTGPFADPFVTFAFLAGSTRRIRFMSAILILPALPAALVAKQAAELALISGGRFDLGVGISWNAAEYRALGQPARGRGARLEEQVTVLRKLWSEPYVTFKGQFHDLDNIGLARPVAAPIPIWFGTGTNDTGIAAGRPARRRLADDRRLPAAYSTITTISSGGRTRSGGDFQSAVPSRRGTADLTCGLKRRASIRPPGSRTSRSARRRLSLRHRRSTASRRRGP